MSEDQNSNQVLEIKDLNSEMSQTKEKLTATVQSVARRLWLIDWIEVLGSTLLYVTAATAVIILIDKLVFIGIDPILLIGIAGVVGLVAGTVFAYRKRLSLIEAAVEVDSRLGLKARTSSALGIKNPTHPVEVMLLRDARSRLEKCDVGAAFPFDFKGPFMWLPLAIGATMALALIPPMDIFKRHEAHVQEVEEKQKLKKRVVDLEKRFRSLKDAAKALKRPGMKAVAKELQSIFDGLKRGEIDRKTALRAMNKLSDKIRREQRRLEQYKRNTRSRKLNSKGASQFQKNLKQGKFRKAAENMGQMANKLRKGGESKSSIEKLGNDLKKLSKDLSHDQKLSKALDKASDDLKAGQIEDAAKTLEEARQAMEDLKNLEEQLGLMREMMEFAKQEEDELSQDNKDPFGTNTDLEDPEKDNFKDVKAQNPDNPDFLKPPTPKQGQQPGKQGQQPGKQGQQPGKQGQQPGQGGKGQGGKGKGQGQGGKQGVAPEDKDVKYRFTRLRGKMGKLHPAGSFLHKGKQVKGEAREAFEETIRVAKKKETEAVEKAAIPKGYKSFVRDYFDGISPGQ